MEHHTDLAPSTYTVLTPSDPAHSRVLTIQHTRLVAMVRQMLDALVNDLEISDDLVQSLTQLCDASPIRVPDVIARSGEWTGYRAGTGHFLWHGTCDKKTGIPIISRWYDETGEERRNVPVHRVLWPLFRSDELVGRPRKLESCSARNCANPLCYGISIPMVTRGFEVPGVRYRRRGAWARRPVWHSGQGLAGQAPNQYPVCTQCKQRLNQGDLHLGDFIAKYDGKQVNCNTCKINDDALRAAAGLRGPVDAYDYSDGYGPRNAAPRFEVNGQHVSEDVWNMHQRALEYLKDHPDE